jgi:hypothetical protein
MSRQSTRAANQRKSSSAASLARRLSNVSTRTARPVHSRISSAVHACIASSIVQPLATGGQHLAILGSVQRAAQDDGHFHEQEPCCDLRIRSVQNLTCFVCPRLTQIELQQNARIEVDQAPSLPRPDVVQDGLEVHARGQRRDRAGTRTRAVTRTVSPSATSRRNSLSLFLISRIPAALMRPLLAPVATTDNLPAAWVETGHLSPRAAQPSCRSSLPSSLRCARAPSLSPLIAAFSSSAPMAPTSGKPNVAAVPLSW